MSDTLDSLRRKIASLYNEGIESSDLGNIALEIILKRNEAERELEQGSTLHKKTEIQRRIDELYEFERVIVSLYMLQGMKPTSGTTFKSYDFARPKYHLFGKGIRS